MRYHELSPDQKWGYRARDERWTAMRLGVIQEQFPSAWRAMQDFWGKFRWMPYENIPGDAGGRTTELLYDCYRHLYVFPYRTPGKACLLPAPLIQIEREGIVVKWEAEHFRAEVYVPAKVALPITYQGYISRNGEPVIRCEASGYSGWPETDKLFQFLGHTGYRDPVV